MSGRDELARAKGSIVNVTSIAGSRVHPFAGAAYGTSKSALAGLTREMAADFGPLGVRVNAISPGYFATDMNAALWQDPEFDRWVTQRTPAQRWGRVEELVGTLLFLASDASSFVSGQNVFVDGGMTVVV